MKRLRNACETLAKRLRNGCGSKRRCARQSATQSPNVGKGQTKLALSQPKILPAGPLSERGKPGWLYRNQKSCRQAQCRKGVNRAGFIATKNLAQVRKSKSTTQFEYQKLGSTLRCACIQAVLCESRARWRPTWFAGGVVAASKGARARQWQRLMKGIGVGYWFTRGMWRRARLHARPRAIFAAKRWRTPKGGTGRHRCARSSARRTPQCAGHSAHGTRGECRNGQGRPRVSAH